MSNIKPISESLADNEIRTYYAMDKAMLQAHRDGKDDYAESTARLLLEYAELPLLIRARAGMVLGCSNASDRVEMAKEAVRIAELAYSRCSDPGEVEKRLVKSCKSVLAQLQEIEAESEDSNANAEELPPIGAAAGEPPNAEPIPSMDAPTSTPAPALRARRTITQDVSQEELNARADRIEARTAEGSRVKKKVRRVHSGDPDDEDVTMEELDEETGQWIERGQIGEGEEMEIIEIEKKAAQGDGDEKMQDL